MSPVPEEVGFVGGGRVVRCILSGWMCAGTLPTRVLVHDPDPAAVERLRREELPVEAVEAARAASAEVVILAVHPPVLRKVAGGLAEVLDPGAAVISLAPSVTLAELVAALSTHRLARVIPNAPSAVCRGYNPVAFAPACPAETRGTVHELLAPLGAAPETAEEELESWAVLTAMGPTALWPVLEALRETGRAMGVDPQRLDRGLLAMAEGAAAVLLGSGREPAEVLDLIPARPLEKLLGPALAAAPTRLLEVYAKIRPAGR